MDIFEKLKKADFTDYAPFPFWSWNNELSLPELISQIHDMKAMGCGGFVLHARLGLKMEYLGEEWFSLVKGCLDEAQKLNMNVWIYDENGWPSGFEGGKLLECEEDRAPYIEREVKDEFDSSAYAVFVKTENGYKRVLKPCKDAKQYECIYVKRSPSNTDILKPELVDKFIEGTYAEYYRRFKDKFGKPLVGFFTDEPQYYRWATPFTYELEKAFKQNYGQDVADGLIYLFNDDKAGYPFRAKYYGELNRLYTENYYKRIYDWCTEHNCMLTGHSIEESSFLGQMLGGAGVMPSYEYEHVPAIDCLGKKAWTQLSGRQVGSVARQTGKKHVLTESFGCSGYDASPRVLRTVAENQYVHGVNMLCHHLYSYSLAGQGKVDHPPCFSRHSIWHDELGEFNEYLTKLGYMLAESETLVNCAVISPLTGVYLNYERFNMSRCKNMDLDYQAFQTELNREGILYDIADERILSRHASVENGSLKIGLYSYKYVIVPNALNYTASTKKLLEQFVSSGGKIFVLNAPLYTDGVNDDWSFLKSNVTLSDIANGGEVALKNGGEVEYTVRRLGSDKFIYMVNVGEHPDTVSVPDGYSRLDIIKNEAYCVDKQITVNGGEGVILAKTSGKKPIKYGEPVNITKDFRFEKCSLNNLTLDRVSISFNGKDYLLNTDIVEAFDSLLRSKYNGKLFVKYPFTVKGGSCKILRREKGKYISGKLNGKELCFKDTDFDVLFEEADISGYVKQGENEYVAELDFYERDEVSWALYDPSATESVRNCLWYDTMVENVYVIGEFCVNSRREITDFVPCDINKDLTENGFKHFAGSVTYKAELTATKQDAVIIVEGEYSSVRVEINGKEAGTCAFKNEVPVTLKAGEKNEITLTVLSTLRNEFGPFHFKNYTENGVSPFTFNMRGEWHNGECKFYDPAYKTLPFCACKVTLAYKK